MILNPITNRKVKRDGPAGKKIIICLKKEDKISQEVILKELSGSIWYKPKLKSKEYISKVLDIERSSFSLPNPPKVIFEKRKIKKIKF